MRVFVTGATGFIGSAVVRELLDAGHQVVGLARSDKAAASLAAVGARAHRGSLDDPASLSAGAASADGVIHTAYIHDFSATANPADAAAADGRAIEALGEALIGSGRPLVVASGLPPAAEPGKVVTEQDEAPANSHYPRVSELAAIPFAQRDVRVAVVRLPFSVHGPGDPHFITALIGVARDKGLSAYVADGSNRWPAVHRLDAARLLRLALESAPAGTLLNAVGDDGVPFRDIAEVIGRHLDVPVASLSPQEAASHFGMPWVIFAQLDLTASSALTQERFGWHPSHPGLIADLDDGHYFDDISQPH